MDTKQNSERLDEVHKTLERAKTYDPHDGFPARFYVRDVPLLLEEVQRLRQANQRVRALALEFQPSDEHICPDFVLDALDGSPS